MYTRTKLIIKFFRLKYDLVVSFKKRHRLACLHIGPLNFVR